MRTGTLALLRLALLIGLLVTPNWVGHGVFAQTAPVPPDDEQAARRNDPLLYRFIDLKATLTGPEGDSVWALLKGKLAPEMRLFVISEDPPEHPSTMGLGSKRGGPVEVILNLQKPLDRGVGSDRLIVFEGLAVNLSRDPFRLTLVEGKFDPVPQRVRASAELMDQKLVKSVPPRFPSSAPGAGQVGLVRLRVVVATDGTVKEVAILSGHPYFVHPVLEAVRQWRYEPTVINGEPIEVETLVEMMMAVEQSKR